MVFKNFTIIRLIPLLYGIIWDKVFLVGGFSRHILVKKVTKTMTYTETKIRPLGKRTKTIFLMIAKKNGATELELANATGQSEMRVRRTISELRKIWNGIYTIHVQSINETEILYTLKHEAIL